MDRPTCETCPYHFVFDPEDWGECRRFPPEVGETGEAKWPIIDTDCTSFCGEHPDFPAWLASRKADARLTTPTVRGVRVDDQGRLFYLDSGEQLVIPGLEPELILRGLREHKEGQGQPLEDVLAELDSADPPA
jgi:hypothetical protein